MGIVRADIRLMNVAHPELGEIDARALVDTGAFNLCLPAHVALQLKLEKFYDRELIFADGRREIVPYCGGVRVETMGRGCVTGACVFGTEVLLGALPMEDMDLIVDPRALTIRPNPDNPNIAVALAMGFRTFYA